jgi:hypothetical protein
MRLTSPTLQILTVATAVAATLAVLLLWNRVRGPKTVRVASRLGLLAGSYLATAVAVLVSVNIAYGGLIVSLSDLFSDPSAPMGHGGGHGHHMQINPDGFQGPGPDQSLDSRSVNPSGSVSSG